MKLLICVFLLGLLPISLVNASPNILNDNFLKKALDEVGQHFDANTNTTAGIPKPDNKVIPSPSSKQLTTGASGVIDGIEATLGQATGVLVDIWHTFKNGIFGLVNSIEGRIEGTTTATPTLNSTSTPTTTTQSSSTTTQLSSTTAQP